MSASIWVPNLVTPDSPPVHLRVGYNKSPQKNMDVVKSSPPTLFMSHGHPLGGDS